MIPNALLKTRMSLTRILRTNDGREQGRETISFYGYFEEGRRLISTVNGKDVEASHMLFCGTEVDLEVDDRFFLGEPDTGVKPRMFTVLNVETFRLPTSGIAHHKEIAVR